MHLLSLSWEGSAWGLACAEVLLDGRTVVFCRATVEVSGCSSGRKDVSVSVCDSVLRGP